MPATSFSCSFLSLQPRFNSYVNPIFRSLTFQLSSSPFPFNAPFSSIRIRCSLSRPAETNSTTGGRSGALTPGPSVGGDVQKIDVNPPKGTRDFPPEDMRLRNWLFNHFKEVCVVLDTNYSLPFCSCACFSSIVVFSFDNLVFQCEDQVSWLYGFEEVDYPVLESEALFTRKAGEEIKDQVSLSLYRFCSYSLWHLTINISTDKEGSETTNSLVFSLTVTSIN